MSARTSPCASAPSTFAKPAAIKPALPAMANASRAARSSSRSTISGRSDATRTSRLKPRANTPRLTACSTEARVPVIHTPRPGSLRFTSGTTAPSGPMTKRMSSETGFTCRLSAQVRSVAGATDVGPRSKSSSCATANMPVSSPLRVRLGSFSFAFRGMEFGLGDPAGLKPRLHDHGFGIFARKAESLEVAGHMLGLAVLALGPADEIIGGASSKILDRLHAVLAERNQHLCGHARNLFQRVLDTELLPPGIEFRLLPIEIFAGAILQFARRVEIKPLDAGNFLLVHQRQLFDRAEAFGGQQLPDHLVEIERLNKSLRTGLELLLTPLGFFLFGQDIDVPTGQL